MAADNRMVLLTSVTAGNNQDELNTAGLLVGELAINTNDGILFAGADPGGVGDGSTAKAAGQAVHDAADVLGIKLSTASTAQALGTGDSPTFAGLTISSSNSLTLGGHAMDDIQVGGDSFADVDDQLMTAAAINDRITSFGYGTGSMSDLSDDTSPQLGADLDTNSFNIKFDDAHGIQDDSGNEQLIFQKTASAVNYLEATNAATGTGVTLGATGGDTNVDLLLTAAGSGVVKADGVEVVTLTGTQTLTNKTLTAPALGTPASGNLANCTFPTANINTDVDVSVANLKARLPQISDSFTIGDATDVTVTTSGDLTVTGDLTVSGTTTTLNTATLDVEDKNITLNKGSGDTSGSADGAGITIQDAVDSDNDATILWTASSDTFTFSHAINADVTGDLTGTASKATVTNSTANTNFPVVFNNESDGLLDDTGTFHYNPSTGLLTTTGLTASGTVTIDGVGVTAIQTSSESFADNDTSLMTSAAINDRFATSAGISDVVDDTSPQLGGDLDTNSNNIKFDDAHGIYDDGNNEQLVFQKTASAVNYLEATNAATGNAPSFAANGTDTNIDLVLAGKGTGGVKLTTNSTRHVLFDFDGATANKTHTIVSSHTDNRTLTLADGDTTLVAGTMLTTSSNVGDLADSVSAAIGIGTIELGHASNTTISRVSAGVIAVEGNNVIMANNDVSALTDSTSAAIGIGTIELGDASDTTLSRSAAGKLAVEGVDVCLLSGAQTLASKTISGGTF
tara:strand:+ start:1016 stop:3238 length:2223 start_codon:yes stop_codon:yes gene_type:complete